MPDTWKINVNKIRSTEDFYSNVIRGLESSGDELDPNYDDDSKDKEEIDLNSVGQNKDELDTNFKETAEAIKEGGDTIDFDDNFKDESKSQAITNNEEDESTDEDVVDHKWDNHPDMTGEVDTNAVDNKDFDANEEDESDGALDKNFQNDQSISDEGMDVAPDPNEQYKKDSFELDTYDPNEDTSGLMRLAGEAYDPNKDALHSVGFRCNCGQEISEESYPEHLRTAHKGDSWFVGEALTKDKKTDKLTSGEDVDLSQLKYDEIKPEAIENDYEKIEAKEQCGICYGDHDTADHDKVKGNEKTVPIEGHGITNPDEDEKAPQSKHEDEPNHEIGSHYLKSKKGSRETDDHPANETSPGLPIPSDILSDSPKVNEFTDAFPAKKDDPVGKVLSQVNGKGEDDIITEAIKEFKILKQA